MRALRMIDDTGGAVPAPAGRVHCSEIGLETFGWNVENDLMADAARGARRGDPGRRADRPRGRVLRFLRRAGASPASTTGARSRPRSSSAPTGAPRPRAAPRGSPSASHRYPQSALTALLAHRLPHRDVSTEFHTREGPFTLVPLPPSAEAPDRSSLVWLMSDAEARRREGLDDAALAREIERQARSILGAMRLEGRRGVFPMVRQVVPRLDRAAARAGRRRRARLSADRRAGAQPRPARRRGDRRGRGRGARATGATSAGASRSRLTSGRGAPTSSPAPRWSTGSTGRCWPSSRRSTSPAGRGSRRSRAVGPLRRLVMREGVAPRLRPAARPPRPSEGPLLRPIRTRARNGTFQAVAASFAGATCICK